MAIGRNQGGRRNVNQYVVLFDKYRKENTNILKWLKRIMPVLEDAKNVKKDLEKKHVLSKKSGLIDKKGEEIFFSLERDIDEMIKFSNGLITHVEKENPEISKFISSIPQDHISIVKFTYETIVRYNKEKWELVNSLLGLMPSFAKDIGNAIQLPMVVMEDSAKNFINYYNALDNAIKIGSNTGAMFESLGILLNYLIKYVGNPKTLSQNDKNRFLSAVSTKSPNAAKLAGNFLDSMGTAFGNFSELNSLMEKAGIDLAGLERGESHYSSLGGDSERKGKIDEFTEETLLSLFDDRDIKLKIKKVYRKSDEEPSGKNKLSDAEKNDINRAYNQFNGMGLSISKDESGSYVVDIGENYDSTKLDLLLTKILGTIEKKESKFKSKFFEKVLKGYNCDVSINDDVCQELLKMYHNKNFSKDDFKVAIQLLILIFGYPLKFN